MISYPEARDIFYKYFEEVKKENMNPENEWVMIEKILERPIGWLFFYQSKKFVETGDLKDALFGTGGVLINRKDGSIIEFGTSFEQIKKDVNYFPKPPSGLEYV